MITLPALILGLGVIFPSQVDNAARPDSGIAVEDPSAVFVAGLKVAAAENPQQDDAADAEPGDDDGDVAGEPEKLAEEPAADTESEKEDLEADATEKEELKEVEESAEAVSDEDKKADQAKKHVSEGNRLLRAGNIEEAYEQYGKALLLAEDPHAYYGIASCYMRMDKKQEAIENFEKFLSLAPEHRLAGRVKETIENLRESLEPAEEIAGEEPAEEPAEKIAEEDSVEEIDPDTEISEDEAKEEDPALAADADEEEEEEEEEAEAKAWGITIGNTIGFGLQIDEALSYYYGQLSLGGNYRVHGPVSVAANMGLYYTPDPLPNDARQLDLGGASISVSHGKLFHDEVYTGVRLSGRANIALPISMGGRARGNYPTVGGGITMARSVGPVNMSFGMTFNKFNPKSQVTYLPLCAEDRGDIAYCIGGYETNWQMGQRISASYSPVENLSLSAGFGTTLTRSYAPSSHDPAMTPSYMHDVRANIRDGFGFSLSGSYKIIDSLSASLSFSNGGPWRSNGQDLYNPLFDPRLASMSVGVSYSY